MMVHHKESNDWSHIVDGLFTKEGAISIFDRMFAGLTPWQKNKVNNYE